MILSPNLVSIHPWSPIESVGSILNGLPILMSSCASALNPTANLAIYVPFILKHPVSVSQFFCYNGTANVGNLDMGIYSEGGTRIISTGTQTQTGLSVLQIVDVTDQVIGPGRFRMSLVSDSALGSFFSVTTGLLAYMTLMGIKSQASAFPLPANNTLATAAVDFIPYFGFSSRSVL